MTVVWAVVDTRRGPTGQVPSGTRDGNGNQACNGDDGNGKPASMGWTARLNERQRTAWRRREDQESPRRIDSITEGAWSRKAGSEEQKRRTTDDEWRDIIVGQCRPACTDVPRTKSRLGRLVGYTSNSKKMGVSGRNCSSWEWQQRFSS